MARCRNRISAPVARCRRDARPCGAPAHQAAGGSASVAAIDPSETYRVEPDGDEEQCRRDPRGEGRQDAEHAGRDRDTFAAVEAQPDRIDVADDRGGAGKRGQRRAAARQDDDQSTAAAPLATSSAITATAPRQVPVVRSTLAAPTLPLPATRTSIPARRASRNANGTEPAR